MKYFLLLGGFTGFAIAFSANLSAGNPASSGLFRGAAGCLIGALLMRGLHFVFMVCVRGHIKIRAAEVRKETSKALAETQTVP